MALVDAGLLSMGASGTIGKTLTFGTWKGRPYVRRRVIPSNPRSGAQTGVRVAMSYGSKKWSTLLTADQDTWAPRAKQLNVSPFNAFTKIGQANVSNLMWYQMDDPAVPVTPGVSPTLGAAAPVGHNLQLTWTDGVSADIWTVLVYRGSVTGFTPSRDNLVGAVDQGTEVFLDLVPGPGTWFYRLASAMTDGTIMSPAAEFSGTAV